MRVGVIRRELQGETVVADRELDIAPILVERAEVVRRLAAPIVLLEGRAIGALRLVVAPHAMQEQPEVVPRRRVRRIDGHHTPIGVDGFLPLSGITFLFARALEPRLRLLDGRRERAHEPGHERGRGGFLQIVRLQVEHRLSRPGIEADAVRLRDQAPVVDDQTHFGERMLHLGVLTTQGHERLADLANGGAGIEESTRGTQRQQIAKRVARTIRSQEIEPS